MKSLLYRSGRLYEVSIKLLHGKNYQKRNNFISKHVDNSSVFDIGCGTGVIKNFLNPNCDYDGIEINDKFIAYAKKNNIRIKKGSVFEFNKYMKKDTIIMVDILHHVYPRHGELLEKARKFGKKKIIVCEPFNNLDISGNLKDRIIENIARFFDNDGNRTWDGKEFNWFDEKELKTFFSSHIKNRKSLKLEKIGNDILAVYEL